MKFSADVIHQSARPADDDRINYAAFEAPDAYTAARMVADWAAVRKYGDDAMSSYLEHVRSDPRLINSHEAHTFRAAIGVYEWREGWGTTVGTTITINLTML